MKPNLFQLSPRELSQDGFITWLLTWSDSSNKQYDEQLHMAGKEFLKLLLDKHDDYQIKTVSVKRQWKKIDIIVTINDEYFLVIEDKVNSSQHSRQLERYKIESENHCSKHKLKPKYVYVITGNESNENLNKVKRNGFQVISRKQILDVLNKNRCDNDIYNEFRIRLQDIEERTNSFDTLEKITSDWRSAEGFFMHLEKKVEGANWRYIHNPRGGFMGFWYCGGEPQTKVYIQIQNVIKTETQESAKGVMEVVVKISGLEGTTNDLHNIFVKLKPLAEKNGISVRKPAKFQMGKCSTLAVVDPSLDSRVGSFDLDGFVHTLQALEKALPKFRKLPHIAGRD